MDDEMLVRNCLAGDRRAFAEIVSRYERVLYNAALRRLGNAEDARDATQNTFVKAWVNLGQFDQSRRLFSWLYRIALNESLNHVKRRGRQEPLEGERASDAPDPERLVLGSDTSHHVQVALMKINEDYRAVLILRHFHDCSYEDMAGILGIPEKTVKSRLFSARRQLKELLEAKGLLP